MININRFIEHTLLKPDIKQEDIEKLADEGLEYNFAGICVPPFWVNAARKMLGDHDVQLVSVAGFPLGYNKTESKIAEIRQALDDGADEIDIVWNLSAFKAGLNWVKMDISKCAETLHDQHKLLKVIIETAFLSDDEIRTACTICQEAGADFVKTSTGFAHAGARVEHIRIMREVLPSHIGIKAAGGIRDFAMARSLIEAGADRLGTSSGVKIIEEANQIQS